MLMKHFSDRLLEASNQKGGPVCIGIDPVYDRLPKSIRQSHDGGEPDTITHRINAIDQFVRSVLNIVAPHVPCVKFQSACFERYQWPGVQVYRRLIDYAKQLGLMVIADVKRGDIGATSDHYTAGCLADCRDQDLGSLDGPDALTVSAYMGIDAIEPFLEHAAQNGKGVFALVRTSNPGGDDIQRLRLEDGRTVAEMMAELIHNTGSTNSYVGRNGYSLLGAVVGATKSQEVRKLRQIMQQQVFLVPGFGAQGGRAEQLRSFFNDDGFGALVSASRSVLYAFDDQVPDWQPAIQQAVIDMKEQVNAVLAKTTT